MNDRKTVIHFFTIADFEEEETWLHNQHKNGWKLLRMIPPCFYIFEKCTPENVAYRLDYKNNEENSSYFQLFKDYGWEYIGRCIGWLYFRKPVSETDSGQDSEIFSDNESRVDMINHVVKTRLFPALIVFLFCTLPCCIRSIKSYDPSVIVLGAVLSVMALLLLYLIIYCGLKMRKLRKKYRND